MQHIAFFRNVNQGQRGHPSTEDLLAAVHSAGGSDAFAFRSNGTVVLKAESGNDVQSRLRMDAAGPLADRMVFVRPASLLEQFGPHGGSPAFGRLEVTVFDPEVQLNDVAAIESASRRGRCEIVAHGEGWALVLNHVDRQSNGTPVVEKITGRAATSRGLPTLLALAERLDL